MKSNQFYSFHPIAQTFGNLVDEFVNRGLHDLAGGSVFQAGYPSSNVLESNDSMTFQLAAPGLEKSDFKVAIEKNHLIISAEIKKEASETQEKFTRKEFDFRSFKREFVLPENLDLNKIQANYEHGILSVKIDKTVPEPVTSRVIDIA